MDTKSVNEKLISQLRDCAAELTKMANDQSLTMDKTASITAPVSSERAEYMTGVMHGLGLED